MYERAGDSLGSVFYCDVIASVLLTLLLCNLTVMLCACRQLPPFLLLLQVCTRTRHSCMCSSGFMCVWRRLWRTALRSMMASELTATRAWASLRWLGALPTGLRRITSKQTDNGIASTWRHVCTCTFYVKPRTCVRGGKNIMSNKYRLLIDSI